ncbi:DUF4265 domain-containing protein [Streptomyces sp. NBC_01261]|uniref:DUF4265 domain-containing protein n=1 Tax=Streptomyces sp. NBC_01261 TaxID=2903802 RepID=UPI002E30057F|nr:DUF4265 domain-containing protein [Streptomyces sp. NBC_01261]
MTNPEGPYVKVHFRLEIEDEWPPASVESLWAADQGDGTARQSVINAFREIGVCCEGMEKFGMVALDVPPTADLAEVQRLLNHGVAKEWWDMEEGCVTAAWRAASAG